MQWILRGRQIGQAVKNVQRLRQIVGTFAKYGFVDVVDRMNLGKFLPGRLREYATQAEVTGPERMRLAFEELGPTFVKLGQLLSTRSDIVPEHFIDEFVKLQDNVQPLEFGVVRTVLERELGRPVTELYSQFEEKPLAAASIGQVHAAVTLDGDQVVVKVQRPEIQKIIDTDISILAFIAGLLEKYVPESKIFSPKIVVDEFFRTISYELDYLVESNNTTKIAENMTPFPEIVIPKVYKTLSSRRVLTLERLEGIRVNDLAALDRAGIDRKRIVEVGAKAFFKSVMVDGIFHGDLHGGNLFVLPESRLGIVDFGIVGRLSQRSRDQLLNMVMSLLTEDYENLCYQYADLGSAAASVDFDGFQREVRNALSPYLGLPLGEVNMGRVFIEATKIAARYNVNVPGDWMLVFKAILTMEGMGRTLDPSFDLMSVGQDLVKDLVKNQYSMQRITKDLAVVGRDMAQLLQSLPRQIRWMFRKFNSNDFAFEIKSPDLISVRDQLDLNGRRMSLSVLVAGFMIAASISLHHSDESKVGDYPLVAVLLFVVGGFFLFNLLIKALKK